VYLHMYVPFWYRYQKVPMVRTNWYVRSAYVPWYTCTYMCSTGIVYIIAIDGAYPMVVYKGTTYVYVHMDHGTMVCHSNQVVFSIAQYVNAWKW
jgi:hypothetical protein